jgi:hypothetical protein
VEQIRRESPIEPAWRTITPLFRDMAMPTRDILWTVVRSTRNAFAATDAPQHFERCGYTLREA